MTDVEILLDRSSPVPLYFQLARELERAIADGRLAKGGFLDNEIELAETWQVSRPTVRRAMQDLVDGGLLVRQRGIGTQVVNDQLRPRARLTSLFDDLTERRRTPTTEVITHEHVVADVAVATALGVAPGTVVVHLERCRSADGRRLAILHNWLLMDVAGDITTAQLTKNGLYPLLRSLGVRPHYAVQRVGARTASPTDAAVLALPVGAPLLTMHKMMQDHAGTPVDVGDHVFDARHHVVESTIVET